MEKVIFFRSLTATVFILSAESLFGMNNLLPNSAIFTPRRIILQQQLPYCSVIHIPVCCVPQYPNLLFLLSMPTSTAPLAPGTFAENINETENVHEVSVISPDRMATGKFKLSDANLIRYSYEHSTEQYSTMSNSAFNAIIRSSILDNDEKIRRGEKNPRNVESIPLQTSLNAIIEDSYDKQREIWEEVERCWKRRCEKHNTSLVYTVRDILNGKNDKKNPGSTFKRLYPLFYSLKKASKSFQHAIRDVMFEYLKEGVNCVKRVLVEYDNTLDKDAEERWKGFQNDIDKHFLQRKENNRSLSRRKTIADMNRVKVSAEGDDDDYAYALQWMEVDDIPYDRYSVRQSIIDRAETNEALSELLRTNFWVAPGEYEEEEEEDGGQ